MPIFACENRQIIPIWITLHCSTHLLTNRNEGVESRLIYYFDTFGMLRIRHLATFFNVAQHRNPTASNRNLFSRLN